MSKKEIQVGQVYRSVGAAGTRAWRVTATVSLLGIPHARIVNTEDEGYTKTLSCFILADSDFYRLAVQPAA
jgi:hypothetical protein